MGFVHVAGPFRVRATTNGFQRVLTTPAVYAKKDVAKVKLKSLQIETSDGIGVGRQLKIKIEGLKELMYSPKLDITGFGALAYPDTPVLISAEVKTVNTNATDEDLFFLETRPIPALGGCGQNPLE